MTPRVRAPLYRAGASVITAASYAIGAVYWFTSAVGNALDERADIFNARADVDEPEQHILEEEEEL